MTASEKLNNLSEFFISTPMIERLHDQITLWLQAGYPGGVIVGPSRVGKTHAIRALTNQLQLRNGQHVPIRRVCYAERDQKTIRDAWARLADEMEIAYNRSHNASTLANQIIHRLMELSLQNRMHQVMLIIDEAQFLTVNQLNVFAEIYNELSEAGVNIMVLFVANKDLFQPMRDALLNNVQHRYIRERFFNYYYQFGGIESLLDLQGCLAQFDRPDPLYSGRSLVQEITHLERDDDWQLASLAEDIWTIYHEEYTLQAQTSSWGMEYFMRFLRILIQDYLPHYDYSNEDNRKTCIVRCFNQSGLNPALTQI